MIINVWYFRKNVIWQKEKCISKLNAKWNALKSISNSEVAFRDFDLEIWSYFENYPYENWVRVGNFWLCNFGWGSTGFHFIVSLTLCKPVKVPFYRECFSVYSLLQKWNEQPSRKMVKKKSKKILCTFYWNLQKILKTKSNYYVVLNLSTYFLNEVISNYLKNVF